MSASSLLICLVTVDCCTPSSSAPRDTLPKRATATKYSTACEFNDMRLCHPEEVLVTQLANTLCLLVLDVEPYFHGFVRSLKQGFRGQFRCVAVFCKYLVQNPFPVLRRSLAPFLGHETDRLFSYGEAPQCLVAQRFVHGM